MCSRPTVEWARLRRTAAALLLAATAMTPAGAADWLAHVRSTDSAIFYHNLDEQLAALQQRRRAASLAEEDALALARLLFLRGQLQNDAHAMAAALDALASLPPTPAVLAQQAGICLGLHRFDEAARILERTPGREAAVLQAELWWNRGQSQAAWRQLERLLEGSNDALLHARKAAWLMEQGRLAAAQQQLEAARNQLSDPHPVPAVWLSMGQARLLSAQGRHVDAYALLLAALRRLPRHVPLLEALAAAERRQGQPRRAAERLQLAMTLSPDPHLPVQLARLLPADQQGPWLAEAEQRFARMMRRYPQVYAVEAAEFYAGQARHGEAAQALALLPPAARGLRDWVLAAGIEAAGGRRQQALDALRAARGSGQYAKAQYCRAALLYARLAAPDEAAALEAIVKHHSDRDCPAANDLEEDA